MGLRTILRIRDLAACDTVVRSKFVQMTLTKDPEKTAKTLLNKEVLGHLFPSRVQETRPPLGKEPLCPTPYPAHTTQAPLCFRPRSLNHLRR